MEIKEIKIKSDNKFSFALHPGRIMAKYLKNLGISQRKLAKQTKINKTIINELVKGKRSFTMKVAIKLVDIFSMPATFWCNLQNKYDEFKIRNGELYSSSYLLSDQILVNQDSYKKMEIVTKFEIICCAV